MPSVLESALYTPVHDAVGDDAHEQYRALQWGRNPRREEVVEYVGPAGQELVALGKLRALLLSPKRGLVLPRPYPWLAVGSQDNRLYIAGGSTRKVARARGFGAVGSSRELWGIHYDAAKGHGARSVYWVHDFEPTRPRLVVLTGSRPHIAGGDYFVADAGIVG